MLYSYERGKMVRISNRHNRFKKIAYKNGELDENDENSENRKHINLRPIDRSRYPKSTFWIIFAGAGAFLLWMLVKFFLLLTK